MGYKTGTMGDLNVFEELKDKIVELSARMEVDVLRLQKKESYKDAISTLFREIHTLRAISTYLNFKKLSSTLRIIEDVLSILRKKDSLPNNGIIDWLLNIADSTHSWEELIEKEGSDFEPINPFVINMVKSTALSNKSGDELLKNLTILYVDESAKKCTEVIKSLCGHAGHAVAVNSAKECMEYLDKNDVDLLVVQTNPKSFELSELVSTVFDTNNIPILIVGSTRIESKQRAALQKLGIHYFLDNLETEDMFFQSILNEKELLAKLIAMAKSFFCEKSIKVQNSQIAKKVAELKPLSCTSSEILKLKSDPNASNKDVSDVVIKDPFVSAKLLKIANSPFSGLKGDISTVHHAVSLLGKDRVMALVLQCEIENFIKINLAPYLMSEEDFSAISCIRMNLATHWYPKISVSMTPHIATAALLGNLGQIIIADEAIRTKKEEKFKELISSTSMPVFAELELFGVSAEDVTADILAEWGLSEDISNLLRYANDIANASDEFKKEAIAIYVIFNTIPSIPTGSIREKAEEMAGFLKEMNFNTGHYLKAVDKLLADMQV